MDIDWVLAWLSRGCSCWGLSGLSRVRRAAWRWSSAMPPTRRDASAIPSMMPPIWRPRDANSGLRSRSCVMHRCARWKTRRAFATAMSSIWTTSCGGSDSPHQESTFPKSREILEKILVDVPEDEKATIASDNVARLSQFVSGEIGSLLRQPMGRVAEATRFTGR